MPLTAAELAAAPQVPEITDFSSRGPSTTTDGDILKPDIAAPGNDVVAAVAPPFNHGRSWDFMSGTSMASPHIAGIGALLKARHPDWLPSEIKSAIMTSAGDTVSSADDPFAQGAGFVNPNGAADPGLVYPTTPNEYRQYMVGLGVQFAPPFDTLTADHRLEPQPGLDRGRQAGRHETVTRRVKNVGTLDRAPTRPTVDACPASTSTVSPSTLTLGAGRGGDLQGDLHPRRRRRSANGRPARSPGPTAAHTRAHPDRLRPVAVAPGRGARRASASGSAGVLR